MATKKLAEETAVQDEPAGPKVLVDMNDIIQNKMTGREIRDFERVQPVKHMNLQRVLRSGEIPYDMLLAIVWILHRRNEPTVTFDDMLDLHDADWDFIPIRAAEPNPTTEPVTAATGS